MRSRPLLLLTLAALSAAVACTPLLPVTERPCPCGSGWTCCPGQNICVPDGELCRQTPVTEKAAEDAGSDAGVCEQTCTLGEQRCDAVEAAQRCVTNASGCAVWSPRAACGGGESCQLEGSYRAPCGCDAGDCVSIDYLSPGPYVETAVLEVHGSHFAVSEGTARIYFNGKYAQLLPQSTDSLLLVRIPDALASPTPVTVTVYNGSSIAQARIEVSAPLSPLSGEVDVDWMGADAPTVRGDQRTDFRYRVRSRLTKVASIELTAVLSRCAPCTSFLSPAPDWDRPVLLAADGGLLPDNALRLSTDESADILVRLSPFFPADGGQYGLLVQGAAGGILSRAGFVPFTVNEPLPDQSDLFELRIRDVELVPDALRAGTLYLKQGENLVLELGGHVPEGTFDLQLELPAPTSNWFAESDSTVYRAGPSGAEGFPWTLSVAPLAGASTQGELRIRVTHRESGRARSMYLGLKLQP